MQKYLWIQCLVKSLSIITFFTKLPRYNLIMTANELTSLITGQNFYHVKDEKWYLA